MKEQLKDIIFYSLEKTIKSYRQLAQKNLNSKGYDITIDQWLVLKTLLDNADISQQSVAKIVFKDYASVTRIIEALVAKELITRSSHSIDRRRFKLKLTGKSRKLLAKIQEDINENRSQALKGISKMEVMNLKDILDRITVNCKTELL
jgi:MarR family transcriptional regulator for hemolysin